MQLHFENVTFGHDLRRSAAIAQSRGNAITPINNRPIKIDITMPGTFNRPNPNVTSPMTKAAITTPGMEFHPRHTNAAEQGRRGVIANRVNRAAKIGAVQQHAINDRDNDEQQHLDGEHPIDIPLSEPCKAGRITAECVIPKDDKTDPAKQAHGADGHHDGRQAQHGSGVPAPYCTAKPIAVLASAMIDATDRSISPAIISRAMANAIIAFSVKLNVASDRFQAFRKCVFHHPKENRAQHGTAH